MGAALPASARTNRSGLGGPDTAGHHLRLSPARRDLDRIREIEERLNAQGKGYFGTLLVPLHDQLVGKAEPMLLSLLAAVGVLLLIACVNTAQLQLAQRSGAGASSAISLGARRLREQDRGGVCCGSDALGGVGRSDRGCTGSVGIRLVRAYGTSRLPRLADTAFDARTVVALLMATTVATLFAVTPPAVVGGRVSLVYTLRRGGRGLAGGNASARVRRLLIVAELTLSVVLVASAGAACAKPVTPGERRHRLCGTPRIDVRGHTAPGALPRAAVPDVHEARRRGGLLHCRADRIRAIPGVQSAGIGKPLPLSGAQEATVFTAEGAPPPPTPAQTPIAEYTVASGQEGMFEALGTPMLEGRDFDAGDREDARPVLIVNQSMAKWLWPGQSAVGKRIHVGTFDMNPPSMTVVGVAADLKRYSLTEAARPEMVVPYMQKPYPSFSTMQFVVRSSLPPAQLLPALRSAIAAVDPGIPIAGAHHWRPRGGDERHGAICHARDERFRCVRTVARDDRRGTRYCLRGASASARNRHSSRAGCGARRDSAAGVDPGLGLAAVGVAGGAVLAVAAGRVMRQLFVPGTSLIWRP